MNKDTAKAVERVLHNQNVRLSFISIYMKVPFAKHFYRSGLRSLSLLVFSRESCHIFYGHAGLYFPCLISNHLLSRLDSELN